MSKSVLGVAFGENAVLRNMLVTEIRETEGDANLAGFQFIERIEKVFEDDDRFFVAKFFDGMEEAIKEFRV